MLARLSVWAFGDTLSAIRVPPALCMAVLVVLVALLAREFGGGRVAQVLAALGLATGVYTLVGGHALLTVSADLPLWAGVALFVSRALLRGEPRWWLAAGAVLGLATYNKNLIALLVVGLAAGLLLAGPRRVLLSPWLWAGAGLAVLLALPNLLYQLTHGWPQLDMAAALSENKGGEMRALFAPMQILLFGPVAAVFAVFGWLRLWREPRVRSLPVAYVVAAALTLISGGRFDYTAGLIVVLFAAGCVSVEAGRWRRAAAAGLALNAVVGALFALPIVPASALSSTPIPLVNEVARESVGWPLFVAQVRAVYDALPPAERARAVVLANSYGEAGALWRAGLPVYSGQNQLFEYGPPPGDGSVAVTAKFDSETGLERQFASCERKATIDNGLGVDNEIQGTLVFVCRGLKVPWSRAWPAFHHYD